MALLENAGARTLLDRMVFAYKAQRPDRQYQLWQEGCHPQVNLDANMMRQKLEYIHNNPVKRGYVDTPKTGAGPAPANTPAARVRLP